MALIALGVTGGIGAYKAVEVARGLQKRGHDVVGDHDPVGPAFVGEVTFEAITRRPVITDQYARGANADIEHIALASDIDLLLVAPATANIIGKFANGIADDFLTSLYLATRAPVLMAPAMNTHMLEHEAVRRNLATLAARGVRFVDPGEGYLACGWIGKGRLAEPDEIVDAPPTRSCARPGRCAAGSCSSPPARPTKISTGPLHRQPIERQDGLRDRRRGGAPRRAESCSCPGPTHARAARRRRGDRRAQRRGDARGHVGRMRPMRTSSSWRPRSPTTRPNAARVAGKIEKSRRR